MRVTQHGGCGIFLPITRVDLHEKHSSIHRLSCGDSTTMKPLWRSGATKGHSVIQPIRLKLEIVSGFTSDAIAKWAKASLLPKAIVTIDGLGCFAAVTEAGCIHRPRVVNALKPRVLSEYQWINPVLCNLKTMRSGAFKALKYRKYAQNYLGAFAYRFNHRFDLRDLIVRLIVDEARTKLTPEKTIRGNHANARF